MQKLLLTLKPKLLNCAFSGSGKPTHHTHPDTKTEKGLLKMNNKTSGKPNRFAFTKQHTE
jgi:hypothetical protein